jgi:acyl dehydratase
MVNGAYDMKMIDYQTIHVGQTLQPLTLPPISRATLALFAGASGDHNPIHIDSDFAKMAGMSDVFAHGMLSMAYLGRLLTQWVPQQQIIDFNARFSGMTHLADAPHCIGKVVEKIERDGQQLLKLELQVNNQVGGVKIVGEALIAV